MTRAKEHSCIAAGGGHFWLFVDQTTAHDMARVLYAQSLIGKRNVYPEPAVLGDDEKQGDVFEAFLELAAHAR